MTDKHERAQLRALVESCTAAHFECCFAHPVVTCLMQTCSSHTQVACKTDLKFVLNHLVVKMHAGAVHLVGIKV